MISLSLSDQNLANIYVLMIPIASSFMGTFVTNFDSTRVRNWEKLVLYEFLSRVNLAFVGFYGTMLILVTFNGNKLSGSFMLLMLIISSGIWIFIIHIAKAASKNLDIEDQRLMRPGDIIQENNPNDKVEKYVVKHAKRFITGSFVLNITVAILICFTSTTSVETNPPNNSLPSATNNLESSNGKE